MCLRLSLTLLLGGLIAGCTISIPPFRPDLISQRSYQGAAFRPIISMAPPAIHDQGQLECRIFWDLQVGGGQTFTDYLGDALEQQLGANRYNAALPPKRLHATLGQIDFTTKSGYAIWTINVTYQAGGERFTVSTEARDIGSFISYSACERVASLFADAVAEHIQDLIDHPVFERQYGLYR